MFSSRCKSEGVCGYVHMYITCHVFMRGNLAIATFDALYVFNCSKLSSNPSKAGLPVDEDELPILPHLPGRKCSQ